MDRVRGLAYLVIVTPPQTTTEEVGAALGIDRSPSAVVDIDHGSLARISGHLLEDRAFRQAEPSRWDDDLYWIPEAEREERSQYFAFGNAINFRFWRLRGGQIVPAEGTLGGHRYRGALYMWRCLRLAWERVGTSLLEASFLESITPAEFDRIFRDDNDTNPLSIGIDERMLNLRDLGASLNKDWGGRFFNLVEAANGSLVDFSRLSRTLRAFDDPLYKLTMVNAILHSGSGTADFDAHMLPAIDYHLLKQLLRQGVLRPETSVLAKLKQHAILTSDEGYELRRLALGALLEISAKTRVPGEVLDNRYWLNRDKCRTDSPVCLDPSTAASCPFYAVCLEYVDIGLPLELTRYY